MTHSQRKILYGNECDSSAGNIEVAENEKKKIIQITAAVAKTVRWTRQHSCDVINMIKGTLQKNSIII